MPSKLSAAVSATIFTFAASAMTAQAQTPDASKKKIENITNYGAVQTSTGPAKGYTGQYTANPPKRKTDLQTAAPPSPATPKNPNGGWRGPTNPNPVRVTTSTTTYHAPVSTTTYRAASTPPARTVTPQPVRTVTTAPARVVTTTPPKKP
jgi:hypothetical protein